jgi:hypothetical protein
VSRAAQHTDQPHCLWTAPKHPRPWMQLSHQVGLCFLGFSFQNLSLEKGKGCPSQRHPPMSLADHLITRSNQTNCTLGTLKTLGN